MTTVDAVLDSGEVIPLQVGEAIPSALTMRCMYFRNCDNVASIILAHPILVGVPTCQRCADRVARL